MTEEEKLLEDLKTRKRKSLERVIDIYTPYVSVIVYNIIGMSMTKEDVEEVVADVFVSLWKNAESLDSDKGSIRTYIGAIARNCAANKLRSVHMNDTCAYEIDENTPDSGRTPCEELELREEQRNLLKLINELGEPDSEIFLRYYWYGEKVPKISKTMGICKSTITTKLQRGRNKLKEFLRKEGIGNER